MTSRNVPLKVLYLWRAPVFYASWACASLIQLPSFKYRFCKVGMNRRIACIFKHRLNKVPRLKNDRRLLVVRGLKNNFPFESKLSDVNTRCDLNPRAWLLITVLENYHRIGVCHLTESHKAWMLAELTKKHELPWTGSYTLLIDYVLRGAVVWYIKQNY